LEQLRTTGAPRPAQQLEALASYVESLDGGRGAELAVKSVDALAKHAYKDIRKALAAPLGLGGKSVVIGFLVWAFALFGDLGSAAMTAILLAGSAAMFFALRSAVEAGNATLQAIDDSWTWASRLGHPTERALTPAREVARQLALRGAGSANSGYKAFAAKARLRAQAIVVFSCAAIAFAVTGLGVGVIRVVDEKTKPVEISAIVLPR
jgi:hypothetical protein